MLKVSNLVAGYGNIQILRNLSFEVKRGELVTILGTNGAGKTTTMRAISGILPLHRERFILTASQSTKRRPNKL